MCRAPRAPRLARRLVRARRRQVAIAAAAGSCPDVVVLDNRLPGLDGLEALPALRGACPGTRIVMYSSDDGAGPEARPLGADDVVDKSADLGELLRAVLARPSGPDNTGTPAGPRGDGADGAV